MTRARMVRRAVGCVMVAAIVGVAAWFLGMDAPHAVGLGSVVFALGAVLSLLGEQAEVTWPVPSPQPRAGARRDVVQLGWSLGARGGRVSPEAVRRLRGLGAEVLDRYGVRLDDPAAQPEVVRLLGEGTAAMLRKGSAAAPRPKEFAASLARLEALAGIGAAGDGHAIPGTSIVGTSATATSATATTAIGPSSTATSASATATSTTATSTTGTTGAA